MRERREYIRIDHAVPVTHRVCGTLLGGTCDSEDISAGGVSFSTVQKIDPGMCLNMDIALPGHKPITASGKIVWQNASSRLNSARFIVGAKFIDIAETDRKKILNYIKETVGLDYAGKQ